MKFCAKCGARNDDDVLFCMNCGNKFEVNNENEPQEQNPQTQQSQPIQQPEQLAQPPQFYQPQQPPPQQQQPYQPYQPQMGYYVQPQMPVPGKGMAIASLVLGICAVCFLYLGLVLGIVGIVLAVMGKKKMMAAGYPTGLATAGLVLSILGLIFGAIITVSFTACMVTACNAANSYSYYNYF